MGPLNSVNVSAPVNTPNASQESASDVRQIVTAIRGLNKEGARRYLSVGDTAAL